MQAEGREEQGKDDQEIQTDEIGNHRRRNAPSSFRRQLNTPLSLYFMKSGECLRTESYSR